MSIVIVVARILGRHFKLVLKLDIVGILGVLFVLIEEFRV